jgi:pimeloyl-ACP methyl ester carboxylesterase
MLRFRETSFNLTLALGQFVHLSFIRLYRYYPVSGLMGIGIYMKVIGSALRTLLMVLVGIYLGYGAYYLVIQRKILYPKPAVPAWDVAVDIPGLEKVWLETSSGAVEAWYLPPSSDQDTPSPGLIFFHGNGEVIDYWPRTFNRVQQLGVAVLLVEYPGYGRSAGKPTKSTISETALAAYDALASRPNVDPNKIVVYGRSLGGGAACMLAGNRPVAALILQSTFTNTTYFGRMYLLPGFLILDQFDNLAGVEEYTGPVIVFHGLNDDLIPFEQAEQLAAAAGGQLVPLECTHSDCPGDFIMFWSRVEEFLRENGIL